MILKKISKYILDKTKFISKSERLIYLIIFLWVVFGILGIFTHFNLIQIAGYYTSLTLFVSTYLWGEHNRGSNSSGIIHKGASSSREIIIYITVILWVILGVYGILELDEINTLTVYFTSLSPFVISYIIYKTTKGADLPIFNTKNTELIDKAFESVDISKEKENKTE